MWILSVPDASQYNIQAHERWLRPGHSIAIGRHPDNDIVLDGAKTISKKHLEIHVSSVKDGSSSHVDERSTLTINDLQSKFKTHILPHNTGEEVAFNGEFTLKDTQVSIRLGKAADVIFKVYWKEVVFTLSNIKPKEVQSLCDRMDFKYSKNYIEQTTYVVTNKYNTPKTLQALALQRFIVGIEYVKALSEVADQLTKNLKFWPEPTNISLLPKDAFSEEFGHEIFSPRANRDKSFSGLTFVFFNQDQHKSLTGPIEAGGGQSRLYSGKQDEAAITKYVQALARPVIIPPVNDEELTETLDLIVLKIKCATMTQGDFIRVLISDGKHEIYTARMLDPAALEASLQRSVEESTTHKKHEDEATTSQIERDMSTSKVEAPATQVIPQTQPENQDPPRKRKIGARMFKPLETFDDDLFGGGPNTQSGPSNDTQQEPRVEQRKAVSSSQVASNTPDLSDTIAMSQSNTAVPVKEATPKSRLSRKRTLFDEDALLPSSPQVPKKPKLTKSSEIAVEEEEEFEVAPAAAAFEKARSQARQSQRTSQSEEPETQVPASAVPTEKRERRKQNVDITDVQIQETLRANLRKVEQQTQAHAAEDNLENCENLKNLGSVEYFQVELRDEEQPAARAARDSGSRWNPSWNGRKNFKRFRRPTKDGHRVGGNDFDGPSIMIRLVESKPSNRALLDKQWLETAATRDSPHVERAQSRPGRASGSQALFMPAESDSEDDPLKFRM